MHSGDTLTDRLPTEDEARTASAAIDALAQARLPDGSIALGVEQGGESRTVTLPSALGQLVLDVLGHVGNREMVTLVAYGAELTTQAAADLLNVSRPFLIKLLERGEIGHHKVGAHRRIPVEQVLAYKARRDRLQDEAMRELQALGRAYDAA